MTEHTHITSLLIFLTFPISNMTYFSKRLIKFKLKTEPVVWDFIVPSLWNGRRTWPVKTVIHSNLSEKHQAQILLKGSVVKNPPASTGNVRDAGLIPEPIRSPGREQGDPLQCSCLENPMDRWAWQPTFHRVAKSQTRLKQFTRQAVIIHLSNEIKNIS